MEVAERAAGGADLQRRGPGPEVLRMGVGAGVGIGAPAHIGGKE